jgi:aspartate aminotransferase
MTLFAAERLGSVKPPAFAMFSQRAKAMRASGEDVIDLGPRVPEFATPPHFVEAAPRAERGGQTRYLPTPGTFALKEAVQAKFERDNDLSFQSEEIIVSNSAKQVIFSALMTTIEPDDEVILAAPNFDSYQNIICLLGGVRRVIPTRPRDAFDCLLKISKQRSRTGKRTLT